MNTRPDTPNPARKLAWLTLCLLLAAVGLLAVSWLACRRPPPPSRPPVPVAASPRPVPVLPAPGWGHAYAGCPRPNPSFTDTLTVLTNAGYIVGYSESKKNPAWVCFRLFGPGSRQAPPRPSKFSADERTEARVRPEDYTRSGYDRGHMAPNYAVALCYGVRAQAETFLMSNIIPQRPKLNRTLWKDLEQREIRDYAQPGDSLWVVTGPVFADRPNCLRAGVAIPDACYRILVTETKGRPRMLAFLVPQSIAGTESLSAFLTRVDDVEEHTRLDFFSELPDEVENVVEAENHRELW